MQHTAHSIDTLLASRWSLVGKPSGVRAWRGTDEVHLFVQRSHMRGRPWLRFSLRLDDSGEWYVTAYKTKGAALKG
jgi:hypothetical protein